MKDRKIYGIKVKPNEDSRIVMAEILSLCESEFSFNQDEYTKVKKRMRGTIKKVGVNNHYSVFQKILSDFGVTIVW